MPKKIKNKSFLRPNMEPYDDAQAAVVKKLGTLTKNLGLNDTSTLNLTWEAMDLKPAVLRGIYAHGYEKPAGVQKASIVPIALGLDVILQAQSGMGKTAALVVGTLERIDPKTRKTQILLLTPTRELASQIAGVFREFGQFMGVKVDTLIGGRGYVRKKKSAARRKLRTAVDYGDSQVVVGTPGRVLDLLQKEKLDLSNLLSLALDEADVLMSYEFGLQLSPVLKVIPGNTQVILMSATMSKGAVDKAKQMMRPSLKFLLPKEELTLQGICQFYVELPTNEDKLDTIHEILKCFGTHCGFYGIIFCNYRQKAEELSKQLKARGMNIPFTNGKLLQSFREKELKGFRTGENRILISTHLLGRGIDVQGINIIINYDIPEVLEYIHRVGRAGRYGRKGVAITFVTNKEVEKITKLNEFYSTFIDPLPENLQKVFDLLGLKDKTEFLQEYETKDSKDKKERVAGVCPAVGASSNQRSGSDERELFESFEKLEIDETFSDDSTGFDDSAESDE